MRRKSLPKVLPFLAGALLVGSVLVACDHPVQQQADATPASRTEGPRAAPMDVPAPRSDAQPAAPRAPTPLPAREALADTAITSRIKAEILGDPAMEGSDVSVNTDRGVVVLAGQVKTPEQTAVASAHAQRQDGVMRVDNHLAPAPQ